MAGRVNILAFDTSTQACTVALLIEGDHAQPVIHSLHRVAPMQHTQLILGMIDTVLSEAGLSLNQLTAVALGVGPGSFTGTRLGVSVAQGLGFAHGLPVVPVSSMQALALTAFMQQGHKQVLVSLDARSEQMLWAGYHITEAGEVSCIIPEQLTDLNAATWPENEQWVGVGDGWKLGHGPDILITDIYPSGAAIAKLGLVNFRAGVHCLPADLEPHYLR